MLCELATVRRIPIGDTDLLIAVDSADLLRGDNAVDNVEAPVVGAILLYAEEVRAVVILYFLIIAGLEISRSASQTYASESRYLAHIAEDMLFASLYAGFSIKRIIGYLYSS